jgi:hypothetical protein
MTFLLIGSKKEIYLSWDSLFQNVIDYKVDIFKGGGINKLHKCKRMLKFW